jgi:hypothetical protein
MKKWTSVPTGSHKWDGMKPLGSHTTTERIRRRQAQEFRMALKRGCFAGLGKRQRKSARVCWAGNWCVKWVSHSDVVGDEEAEAVDRSWDIREEASECLDKGSVHEPPRPCRETRSTVMWWRLPMIFQGANERFLWLAQTEVILHVHTVGMELSQSPPWWCDPCVWVWWIGRQCEVAGCSAPSWYSAPPRPTCPKF